MLVAINKESNVTKVTLDRIWRYSCGSGGNHLPHGSVLDGSLRYGEKLVASIVDGDQRSLRECSLITHVIDVCSSTDL
jgi:hypothetical protein